MPRAEPLDLQVLKEHGVTAFRASALARSGWLVHLARGAYMLPGDMLTRDGCLAFLGRHIRGLHVGGRTALAWQGVIHYVRFTETLDLWGDDHRPLPGWFKERFPSRYQVTQLFDEKLKLRFGVRPLPEGRPDVLVSVPERALLELLSDAAKVQSLDETRKLVEPLYTLRHNVLDELLAHTTRIKVARLAEELSREFGLPWASIAKQHSQRLGGGKRWVSVSRSGERLDLRRRSTLARNS